MIQLKLIPKLLNGPELYSTCNPRRVYEANFLENTGSKLLYFSNLITAIAWPTSPIWLYYCSTRFSWNRHDAFHYIRLLLIYHLIAYFTRTIGRSFNTTYRQFIKDYSDAVLAANRGQGVTTQLKNYDFQIKEDAPVSFISEYNNNLWYLPQPASNANNLGFKEWFKKAVAYVCVHTFGRRLLYPGSLGVLKTLIFQYVSSNRLKLIIEQGAERWQLRASDGNIIDGVLLDRREVFPDEPLIICCDGNGGFYETGILKTPAGMNYSVLGWNPPGFSESTGLPYPANILNAMEAVLQFAFSRGFTEDNIIIFGWSIGGFPATWAAANHPSIRGLILDASFDHVLPLALATMPSFAAEIVEIAIKEHFNLDVASQLNKYPGPVRIIRRFHDEVVTSYHGPDEVRRRRENRGNHLFTKFLVGRYPDVFKTKEDLNKVFDYLNVSSLEEKCSVCRESYDALVDYEIDYVLENIDLRQHLIRLICFSHFYDVQDTHITPLKSEEFVLPNTVNFYNFKTFLHSFGDML